MNEQEILLKQDKVAVEITLGANYIGHFQVYLKALAMNVKLIGGDVCYFKIILSVSK